MLTKKISNLIPSYSRLTLINNSACLLQSIRNKSSSQKSIKVDNPYSGDIYCEVPIHSWNEIEQIAEKTYKAQKEYYTWTRDILVERQELCRNFVQEFRNQKEQIAKDLTGMMGKPYQQSLNEVNGMCERAEAMIDLSSSQLSVDILPPKTGFIRKIRKEPKGIILIIAPWNYPLLCTINSLIPALLSGNGIILKLSSRTPLIAEYFANIFEKIGAPKHLISFIHSDHNDISKLIQHPKYISHVVFTGSVQGGKDIQQSIQSRFIDCTLELGGKDPAYIMEDANIKHAADTIIDGAFYNAGQSCCGIERCYVHEKIYDDVIDCSIEIMKNYKLGNPMNKETNLGPLASSNAPLFLQSQVEEAVSLGGKIIFGNGKACHDNHGKGRFFSPTLVDNCNHQMRLMMEESFGPVLGIQKVKNDEEALQLMNDSPYGLTAAVFSNNIERVEKLAKKIETGTVFMNRCDYLDPYLPWTGVKDTGKGVGLSQYCFREFIKFKGLHFKTKL